MIRKAALLLAAFWTAPAAGAVECSDVAFEGSRFTICEVDAVREQLQLFLRDGNGQVYGHFSTLEKSLAGNGKTLAFATNAGMYHSDRSPVGLYLDESGEEMRLVTNAGPGNFGLLPNGVLCIRKGRADVFETLAFERAQPGCTYATQSGPMLVIDGALHPRFLEGSDSRYIRNGVGTSKDGRRTVFVISRNLVNFYDFASFFRDHLGLNSALYFDGNISRFHAPALGRSDAGFAMGPIVGVVRKTDASDPDALGN